MTSSTQQRLPAHLHRYVVDQDYGRYTPEDQAVWRFIMRQLKDFLSTHAHECYLDGLKKTGITVDQIPSIESIDRHLEKFGWGAVPVSGFIPPVAFIEFQALGILPIASDMRTLDHLMYTPAPDIVHEAAGHAPILADPGYGAYIRRYGSVARHSIISREDLDQYEAIRILSDIKEDPTSSAETIERADLRLKEVTLKMKNVSEAALLSRMGWWTTEYGLIGHPDRPRIFGAGLLSSVGESRSCFDKKVKKIPLSIECIEYSYDITEPQPQLFVARDFDHLGEVLDQLSSRLSFQLGGRHGLEKAIQADNVNSVQLSSGLQISGHLKNFVRDNRSEPAYLQFQGPCQLSVDYHELDGHGSQRHPTGFSCPVGKLKGSERPLEAFSDTELERVGVRKAARSRLEFQSGVIVEGQVVNWVRHQGQLILITFKDCKASLGAEILFDPSWGEYDMAVGEKVVSVFGGPADRENYGETADFIASVIPKRQFTKAQKNRFEAFKKLRSLREDSFSKVSFQKAKNEFLAEENPNWLMGVELLELTFVHDGLDDDRAQLKDKLKAVSTQSPNHTSQSIADGLRLADQVI